MKRASAAKPGSETRAPERLSEKVVARLALYRRLVDRTACEGKQAIFSHELAHLSGATPAQVRRDLMSVRCAGHPIHGYDTIALRSRLDAFLGTAAAARLALAGIGNLGRALLAYFSGSSGDSRFVAAFDSDRSKTGRTVSGCHCYPVELLPEVVVRERVDVGVIAVPSAEAQKVADLLVASGVPSIINLAAVPLQLPPHVFVEEVDFAILVERAAFYARSKRNEVTTK